MPLDFSGNGAVIRRVAVASLFLAALLVSCFFLYRAADSASFGTIRATQILRDVSSPPSVNYKEATDSPVKNEGLIDSSNVPNPKKATDSGANAFVTKKDSIIELPLVPNSRNVADSPVNAIPTTNNSLIHSSQDGEKKDLKKVLKDASMKDKTVILTTLNEAWADPNSIFDLFLESFKIGEKTRHLLNHLVIICLDQKAFSRCKDVHPHCFALIAEGVDFSHEAFFMTPDYLDMMWRRLDFLRSVLELGYNFVFTDTDIMWFRDPFPHFYRNVDFQIACDHFSGKSDDIKNVPNGGFNFVKSNKRSIKFYKFWYSSRKTYPGLHDQDVLDRIKNDPFIKKCRLKMRFLDTVWFGGFCEPSENLNKVCTMHANCCIGVNAKLHDLRNLLEDWKTYSSLPPSSKTNATWRVRQYCGRYPQPQNV